MIATVSLDFDGGIQVHQGIYRDQDDIPDDGAIATVKSYAMVALDLFNESRPGFDWDTDSGRAAEMLIWALEDIGYEPINIDEFERNMITQCTPGGPTGGPFQVELRSWGGGG